MSYSDEAIRHEINNRINRRIQNERHYHTLPYPMHHHHMDMMGEGFEKGSYNAYLASLLGQHKKKDIALTILNQKEKEKYNKMIKELEQKIKYLEEASINDYDYQYTGQKKKRGKKEYNIKANVIPSTRTSKRKQIELYDPSILNYNLELPKHIMKKKKQQKNKPVKKSNPVKKLNPGLVHYQKRLKELISQGNTRYQADKIIKDEKKMANVLPLGSGLYYY